MLEISMGSEPVPPLDPAGEADDSVTGDTAGDLAVFIAGQVKELQRLARKMGIDGFDTVAFALTTLGVSMNEIGYYRDLFGDRLPSIEMEITSDEENGVEVTADHAGYVTSFKVNRGGKLRLTIKPPTQRRQLRRRNRPRSST